MDTLSKIDTSAFITPEQRLQLIAGWPTLAVTNATMIMVYAVLRGRDWRRGFTAITNKTKLENGAFDDWALWHVISEIDALNMVTNEDFQPESLAYLRLKESAFLEQFRGLVTVAMLRGALARLPEFPHPREYAPTKYLREPWPFEAYQNHAPKVLSVAS